MPMKLVLASKSPYRKQLLKQAGIAFDAEAANFDESRFKEDHPNLSPQELCLKLAEGKALSLSDKYPDSLIIGSDQLVELEGKILGKPRTSEKAFEQLSTMSGKVHFLHTSIALLMPNQKPYLSLNTSEIEFKKLSSSDITSYLERDEPFDCAGSYKIEKAGLLLVNSLRTTDPSAIQGLSLVDLSLGLRHFGVSSFEI